VELVRTQVSETVTPREISSLPLNGRNYLDLALLAPGVSRTNVGNNDRFAETSAVAGTGISVSGQRNLNNSFVVDGVSANDDAAGLAGTFYSQEVVREFQVISSGGIAEFGRASAGTINILTQSGTNSWRGRLYGFLRNQRLDARNPLSARKDPLTLAQYGASVGGPLLRNRSFLFANFEQARTNRSGVITIAPSNVSAVNSKLDRIDYGGARIQTGAFPTALDTTNMFARVDHKIDDANQLAVRFNFYDVSSTNARNVGGLNDTSRGTALENRDHSLTASNVSTISRTMMNEARFQYTRSRLDAPANDRVGPAINIGGVANLGIATFSPTARSIDLYEAVDNVSIYRGKHSFKAGTDFLYNRLNIVFPGAREGVFTFSGLADFQAGKYINFQQAFGESSQFQANPNVGLFAQDEWRPRSDLTVNAGLRYDAEWLPDPIETDADNLSPRIGIAYAPGDHKTVIRASYGLYYDRIPLRATSNALQRDGVKFKVAILSFGQPGAPVFPNTLASFPRGVLTSVTTIDPRIESSYSQQAGLQVERELPGSASISVGYLHLRGLHLLMSRNVNVPTLSAAEAAARGIPNLGRPDPRFGNIGRFESAGDSYYDGMTISLNKRALSWASLRVAYTLSKTIDNAGNFFFSTPQNNFDIRDDRGLAANDQRHKLSVSGTLDAQASVDDSAFRRMLAGFQMSYIFTYSSALPYNVVTGNDRNFDTNVNDRPVGVGRNTGRGFDFASLDLRVSRRFRFSEHVGLEAIAEGFNVLNRTNLQFPNSFFGPGTTPASGFGKATAASDPRQIQLGLRLSF
ncbi:MAG TPA: TonB-dependent receptor, partial [Blastocatellia bacterium]|nr:TonB-dependent receptor [Blastocatellia bacterium]